MTEEMKFTQSDLDRIITERLDRQKKVFEAKLTALEETKNKTKLLENEEYKTLIEQLTGENKQFSEQVGSLTEKAEHFNTIMQGVLTYELEDLSDEAKAAVEGLPGDVTVKLQWLNDNKALFENTQGDGVGTPAGGTKSGGPKKSQYKMHGI